MPELPEVELTRRNLERWLVGEKIRAVKLPRTRILRGTTPAAIEKLLVGDRVEKIERRGKWLRLDLAGGGALFSHLGMSGKWVRRAPEEPSPKSERARIEVAGSSVRYHDPRMFGRLIPSPNGEPIDEWRALGPDPLAGELDVETFAQALAPIRRSVKEALLDQSVLAGVGNIQASESLWRAKIHPGLRAGALDRKQVRALLAAIQASIDYTLKSEQAPELSYVEEPGAPNPFKVYARKGEPCPRCGTKIARIEQGGRGSFYCPRCQPK